MIFIDAPAVIGSGVHGFGIGASLARSRRVVNSGRIRLALTEFRAQFRARRRVFTGEEPQL